MFSQTLLSQEVFHRINGYSLLPDSSDIRKHNIIQIHREHKYKYHPDDHDYYYYNSAGSCDSLISWSSDDDDTLLCISREYMIYENMKFSQLHVYSYYNVFSSGGEDGEQWRPCNSQLHVYYIDENNIDPKNYNTDFALSCKADTSKPFFYQKLIKFYSKNELKRDSLYTLDNHGNENIMSGNFFLNDMGEISKHVSKKHLGTDSSVVSEVRYEYNDAGLVTKKFRYPDNSEDGQLLRTWSYDRHGRLVFEEAVVAREFGEKSRRYFYDKNNRLVRIKEKHSKGGIWFYTISYNEMGLLKEIVHYFKGRKYKNVQTFRYLIE